MKKIKTNCCDSKKRRIRNYKQKLRQNNRKYTQINKEWKKKNNRKLIG